MKSKQELCQCLFGIKKTKKPKNSCLFVRHLLNVSYSRPCHFSTVNLASILIWNRTHPTNIASKGSPSSYIFMSLHPVACITLDLSCMLSLLPNQPKYSLIQKLQSNWSCLILFKKIDSSQLGHMRDVNKSLINWPDSHWSPYLIFF